MMEYFLLAVLYLAIGLALSVGVRVKRLFYRSEREFIATAMIFFWPPLLLAFGGWGICCALRELSRRIAEKIEAIMS